MVMLFTRTPDRRKNARHVSDTEVGWQLLADSPHNLEGAAHKKRKPLVEDVGGFISEMQQLLDEVNPSDGVRDTIDDLLHKVEADPTDPIAWDAVRSVQLAMYRTAYRSKIGAEQQRQPLTDYDRSQALMSLKFAEMRGDKEAVQVLHDALAVGQAATGQQVDASQPK